MKFHRLNMKGFGGGISVGDESEQRICSSAVAINLNWSLKGLGEGLQGRKKYKK